jgi:hypothetical protein
MKVGKQNLERTQISKIKGLSKQMPSPGDGRAPTYHAQGLDLIPPWQKENKSERGDHQEK